MVPGLTPVVASHKCGLVTGPWHVHYGSCKVIGPATVGLYARLWHVTAVAAAGMMPDCGVACCSCTCMVVCQAWHAIVATLCWCQMMAVALGGSAPSEGDRGPQTLY